MSGRNNDELAKALAALANGQVPDDSESAPSAPMAAASTARVRVAVALSAPVAASGSVPRVPAPPVLRPWGPSLFVKQTLIPILLTLGVVCLGLGLLGYFVDPTSPYSVFAEGWFSFPFIAIGVIMLGLGIVMMLLVREELARKGG